jgi:Transcription initiation factor IIA, gamma subunit, helical domain
MALTDSLDELITSGAITPQLAMKVLQQVRCSILLFWSLGYDASGNWLCCLASCWSVCSKRILMYCCGQFDKSLADTMVKQVKTKTSLKVCYTTPLCFHNAAEPNE